MPASEVCCLAAIGRPRGRVRRPDFQPRLVALMRVVAVVGVLVACMHAGVWACFARVDLRSRHQRSARQRLLHAVRRLRHPDSGGQSTAEQIRADLKAIAPYTRAIRTYSSTGGVELVPEIAARVRPAASRSAPGSTRTPTRNEREIALGDRSRPPHRNIDSVVVGNETIFRGEQTVDELIKMIQRVKRADLGAGDHRRNLERLDRASRAGLGGRLHRRPHPALLGRHSGHRRPSIRRSASTTSCARPIPASAS